MAAEKNTSIKSKSAKAKGECCETDAQALSRTEWDFEKVPHHEKRACLWYEFSRESRAVLHDLTLWLKHFPRGTQWPSDEQCSIVAHNFPAEADALKRFHASLARIAIASPNFPTAAWLSIPSGERKRAMELVRWNEVEDELSFSKKVRDHPILSKFSIDSFRITDWGWTDDELLEQFRRWLLENRPEPPDYARAGRKSSPADLLSNLGALRLSRHAKARRGSRRKIIEVKADPRNFNRAVKKAEAFLAAFYR